MSDLTFWRSKAVVKGKRKLSMSMLLAFWLTWPLLLWAAVIVAANAIGHATLAKVAEPIVTFNSINFVEARLQRVWFYLQVRRGVSACVLICVRLPSTCAFHLRTPCV